MAWWVTVENICCVRWVCRWTINGPLAGEVILRRPFAFLAPLSARIIVRQTSNSRDEIGGPGARLVWRDPIRRRRPGLRRERVARGRITVFIP